MTEYRIDVGDVEQATWIANLPALNDSGHHPKVRVSVELDDDALVVLAGLPEWFFDRTVVWIGGTAYPVYEVRNSANQEGGPARGIQIGDHSTQTNNFT